VLQDPTLNEEWPKTRGRFPFVYICLSPAKCSLAVVSFTIN